MEHKIMQIISITIILFFLYFLYKYIKTLIKVKRLEPFSIKTKNKTTIEGNTYGIINKFSKFLRKLIVFNSVCNSYNKYIDPEDKVSDEMDYISIKILLGSSMTFLYLLISFLYKQNIDSFLILITFLIGFLTPDFYWQIKYQGKKNIIKEDILQAIIIMNNSYRANKNTEQAIRDVIKRTKGPIKEEYQKIMYDLKLSFTISEAFKRMYDRTKIKVILEISNILALMNVSGTNIIALFEEIEHKLLKEEKINNKLNNIKSYNTMFGIISSVIPLIVLVLLFVYNESYRVILLHKYSFAFYSLITVIYLFYIYLIYKMVRGRDYE